VICTAILLTALLGQKQTPNYSTTNFDEGWRFALGSSASATKDFGYGRGSGHLAKAGSGEGPVNPLFGDGKWRQIDLPHDWAIELPFDQKADGSHGHKAIGRDFPDNSVGWYRKSFQIGKDLIGKRISLTFDGIFRNAQVWCNGTFLKRNDSGYIGFTVDLTNTIRYGSKNVVTVRVDASEFEGWFYEGAGIYRHTWLNINEPVKLVKDGQFLIPKVDKANGVVETHSEVQNNSNVTQKVRAIAIIDGPNGPSVSTSQEVALAPGEIAKLTMKPRVNNPKLWSIDSPFLYDARVQLTVNNVTIDEYKTKIGFRTVVWDPNKGLTINGKYTKIQGTCNHQDSAGVGSALPDRLNYWRIEQLKKMGCNAYRTSHNPPTPELLDACDKLGMIVLDETRAFGATEEAQDQLTRLIRRDRNHPSVIFWSIGNEEFALNGSEEGQRMGKAAVQLAHMLDPTRVTTYAGNNGGEYYGVNASVDIRGFNYGLGAADQYHMDHPLQPVHGSETASTTTTRGTYADDYRNGRVSAYDGQKVGWGSGAEEWWMYAAAREWFIGGFVWTGFDYRGEPTPTGWPTINSHFGIMDTCGFPKDIYYYYQSWWTDKLVVHILPHWNWRGDEGKVKDVWVYSNAEEIELFLNSRSLGKQKMPFTGHLSWKVPYEPGKLVAKALKGGKEVGTESVETTGDTEDLRLEADRSEISGDGKDISVINLYGLDAGGRVVPTANDKVEFEIEGPGKIIGVGNGNPTSLEPDTYVPSTFTQDLSTGWKFARMKGSVTEASPMYDDSKWETVDAIENQHMPSNSDCVLRKKFNVSDVSKWSFLDIGAIDDLGEIYVNGALIRKTDTWNDTYQFKTSGLLKSGENTVVIFVHNNGGDGGFSKGMSLSGATMPAAWNRSLFNGCGQIIVQSTGKGTIKMRAKMKDKLFSQIIIAK
jgi:beta-galactosidase